MNMITITHLVVIAIAVTTFILLLLAVRTILHYQETNALQRLQARDNAIIEALPITIAQFIEEQFPGNELYAEININSHGPIRYFIRSHERKVFLVHPDTGQEIHTIEQLDDLNITEAWIELCFCINPSKILNKGDNNE